MELGLSSSWMLRRTRYVVCHRLTFRRHRTTDATQMRVVHFKSTQQPTQCIAQLVGRAPIIYLYWTNSKTMGIRHSLHATSQSIPYYSSFLNLISKTYLFWVRMQTHNYPIKKIILVQCVKDPLTHCTYLSIDGIIILLSIIYLYIVLFELKVLPSRFLRSVAQLLLSISFLF